MDNSTKANRALKPAASACRVASIRLPVQNSGTHGRSAGRTAISSNAKLYSSNANLHPPNQAASTRDQTQKPTASARRVTPTTPPDLPVRNSGMYSCPTSCTVISSNAKLLAPTKPPAQQPLSSTLLSDTTVTDAYDVALPATDSGAATLPVLRSRGSLFLQRSSQAPVKTASPALPLDNSSHPASPPATVTDTATFPVLRSCGSVAEKLPQRSSQALSESESFTPPFEDSASDDGDYFSSSTSGTKPAELPERACSEPDDSELDDPELDYCEFYY
jgi:hypothetical protein